jgi:hypothetical protein
VPDNGFVFVEVAITTPQESQLKVVEITTAEGVEQNMSNHHTPSNSPIDVTSFIQSNTILVTVIAAVIPLGLIFLAVLLVIGVLIWRARHRGDKNVTNFYDTVTLRLPGPSNDFSQRYNKRYCLLLLYYQRIV